MSRIHANRIKAYHETDLRKITEIPEDEDKPDQATDEPALKDDTLNDDTNDKDQTDQGWYEVDKLLATRKRNGIRQYKIKWKNFKKTSWEPETNIGHALIEDFHILRSQKKRRRKCY